MLYIGIDTGTHTGIALWDTDYQELLDVSTVKLHQALFKVKSLWEMRRDIKVLFEDARQRKWYDTRTARQDRARLQGAGSIKRDCNVWEEFLKDYKIPYTAIPPARNTTKLGADTFQRITKWQGKTSEHSRDAAMLVWRKTPARSLFEQVQTSKSRRNER